jgi:heat shock protein HslJ
MKKIFFICVVLFAIIAITGCSKDWDKYGNCKEWKQTNIKPQVLLNTAWECEGFVDLKSCKIKKRKYNLNFHEDGELTGKTCNDLTGNYTIDFITGDINIFIYTATEMLCPPKIDEELYLETLNKVRFFSLQEDELRLYYNNNQNYLLFKKQ